MSLHLFATAPHDLTELLREELLELGAAHAKTHPHGVAFNGDLALAYRVCLWSRLANRIYLVLFDQRLDNQADLSQHLREFAWSEHFTARQSFAVSLTGQGLGIEHTHFGALLIKDGIVDYFRATTGVRPTVDIDNPDIRIHGHVNRQQFTLSLDLSGHSLHQRGYRSGKPGAAPLKENVAAAILRRAGWLEIAAQGGSLFDPLCGSATFLIEAALMAGDSAPGLAKSAQMGFKHWLQHQPDCWNTLVAEALAREAEGLSKIPPLYGADESASALALARANIQQAGYADVIELRQQSLQQGHRWGEWAPGLVISNPPYGERLGDESSIKATYQQLGDLLKRDFSGWQAAILISHKALGLYFGLKAKREHPFANGPLECTLFRFEVAAEWFRQPALAGGQPLASQVAAQLPELAQSAGAQAFANRLRKNLKQLKTWVTQQSIQAYRVYDADMPEYSVAVDLYHTQEAGLWVIVHEYAAPKTINDGKAKRHRHEILAALPGVLAIAPERIIYKLRERQRGNAQYERLETRNQFLTITEGRAKLRVNFTDYLDTGVFLDHRGVRAKLAVLAQGKSLLNLFCYTASATVQAALGGAVSSLSIDMSHTYLSWAQHNFTANGLATAHHELLQWDVLSWLETQAAQPTRRFDVIFLDPPSFSTSKRMSGTLDIQRDYLQLIQPALSLLQPQGVLLFSTNRQKFKLDSAAFNGWQIKDITRETMPPDFMRNPLYQAWLFF